MDLKKLEELLKNGLESQAYPCYAAAVGRGDEILFKSFGGKSRIFPEERAMTEETLFDMASLSKLIGTTMAALKLIEDRKLSLDNKMGDYFNNCHGKENTTVFQLMTHTSGIKAHFPLWLRGIDPSDAADEILREPFGYSPESDAIYTCMGYILLGRILEKIENESLDKIVKRLVFEPLGMKNSFYNPPASYNFAATERIADTNEAVCGRVHDENAAFLNGVSGNAGVFCDINDCIRFASMVSNRAKGYLSPEIFEIATKNYTPEFEENRGLGFKIVGNRYGHTGFTGTSLYVHRDSGIYAILLTNRVHPSRDNAKLYRLRNDWHSMIFGE